jgi:hypothetical protein
MHEPVTCDGKQCMPTFLGNDSLPAWCHSLTVGRYVDLRVEECKNVRAVTIKGVDFSDTNLYDTSGKWLGLYGNAHGASFCGGDVPTRVEECRETAKLHCPDLMD